MKSFLAGLAAAFVGFFVWVTVSVIYGVGEGVENKAADGTEDFSPPAAFY